MDAEDLVDIDLQFQYDTPGSTRVVVLKPGHYWNPAAGWEPIPATGQPAAAHLVAPQRFAIGGVNRDLWSATLRVDPARMADASLRFYTSDAAGGMLKPIGWFGIDEEALLRREGEGGKPEPELVLVSNLVLQGMMTRPG